MNDVLIKSALEEINGGMAQRKHMDLLNGIITGILMEIYNGMVIKGIMAMAIGVIFGGIYGNN